MELEESQRTGIKGPVVYKLLEPINWGKNETIEEITFQPLKGKHIKFLKKDSGMAEMIQVASKSSGTPMAVFDEMGAQDVMNIIEIMGNSF